MQQIPNFILPLNTVLVVNTTSQDATLFGFLVFPQTVWGYSEAKCGPALFYQRISIGIS